MHGLEIKPQINRIRIWIPEKQEEHEIIHLPPVGISGYFYVDLIDIKTKQIRQHLEFPNLITDVGLDLLGGQTTNGLSDILNNLAVGTGSTTPSTSDTVLVAEIARTNNNGGTSAITGYSSTTPDYVFYRRTRVFTETQAIGQLTELGFFSSSVANNGVCFNRALFLDPSGNPTTIFKTSQDILQVQYEVRLSPPVNDITGTLTYKGGLDPLLSSSFILRTQGLSDSNHWLTSITRVGGWLDTPGTLANYAQLTSSVFLNSRTGNNNINASSDAISTMSLSQYTNGNHYRDVTYTWGVTVGNISGSTLPTLLVISPWRGNGNASVSGMYQMQFTPSLAKSSDTRFDLVLRYSWQRE